MKRNGYWALLWCFLLFQAEVRAAGEQRQNGLALVHATVIDGTGAATRGDLTIIIRSNRISEIAKSSTIALPANVQVINASGKFVIPGLWDMHIHWYDKDYLPLFIANGVTGARMMWGTPNHQEWRKEIEQGSLPGPRMYLASQLIDGPNPLWPDSLSVTNEADARQAVRKVKATGADFIKVYSVLPREAYFAIADEARKQGLPFAGHVPIAVSVKEAAEAGQKSIEHLTGILNGCSTHEGELLKTTQQILREVAAANRPMSVLSAKMREPNRLALETYNPIKAGLLFTELKKHGTWQCPTLVVLRNISSLNDPAITSDPRIKYMPPQFKSMWDQANDSRFKSRTAEDFALGKKLFQKDLEIVGAMQRAGVGILAGTDTGNPYCFPGFSLHDELALLVQAGLTPMEALQAATRNPARFMGREEDLGTVEKGKLADLVLLEANPLDDIANTKRIDSVIFDGRLFSKSYLNEMLKKMESVKKD
jgi:imidazolonepropionase-like amidohydrolase